MDLEGNPRACGGGADMGAYELCEGVPVRFLRGNPNGDVAVDLADVIFCVEYLFQGGPGRLCLKALDANDDGILDVSDPIALLGYLFLGQREPPPPFESCGIDPTADELTCESYGPCGR
jgi:hypothetical protein